MTSEARNRAIALITNPPPGSKLAKAKEFGVDLTLLVENLELTPTERAKRLTSTASSFREVREAVNQANRTR